MEDLRPTYLTHSEVLALLRVDWRVIRKLMKGTPDSIEKPWVRYGGTDRRPRYRWRYDLIDGWWVEVNRFVHAHNQDSAQKDASR